ncbi:hypothetical protein R1sor_024183 [Riccia sorocarpa]|uniref:Uncharacterized protein n=1 Tax=Riccia sorocarpa TaxID=122646 RepID=A0ABD3GPT3_9MARC
MKGEKGEGGECTQERHTAAEGKEEVGREGKEEEDRGGPKGKAYDAEKPSGQGLRKVSSVPPPIPIRSRLSFAIPRG